MDPVVGYRQALEAMCDVFNESEDWLVKRVLFRAGEQGLGRAPRSEESWRESIRGLSDAIFQAIYVHTVPASEQPLRDPILAFGVVRARTHATRGVHHEDWITLFRVYREAYVDLLESAGFDRPTLEACRAFVAEVFDRFEAGFRQEYEALGQVAE